MTTTEHQSVTLYYREGASDKVYQINLEPREAGFVVNFAYGRRGLTLNTGTKTAAPVDLQRAQSIFDKLVREKRAKGYAEREGATPYQHTTNEDRISGFLPQLTNPVDQSEMEHLIQDQDWCAQEKFDGKRVLIQKVGPVVRGINRKGLRTGLPGSIAVAASVFKSDFVIDGECVGEIFHVFDVLIWAGEDLRAKAYKQRLTALLNLLGSGQQRQISYADTAWRTWEKNQLLQSLRASNKEGIVFKRIDAPYTPGRPNSGGNQLKHKFYSTASAIVGKINEQRSVELLLVNGSSVKPAGNVTIPPNHPIPTVGAVIEVRYLYAFKESGCLYQPIYLGQRSDIEKGDCTAQQLKFKSAASEDEQ